MIPTSLAGELAQAVDSGQYSQRRPRQNSPQSSVSVFTNLGPAQVLTFDGVTDYLTIAETSAAAASLLPKKEMTATAWVFLDDPASAGGILGLIEDRGGVQKGWHLGDQEGHVHFTLSSAGVDDGDENTVR